MLGVADLARALASGTAPRASGELALHVLEIMEAILRAADTRSGSEIAPGAARPAALPEAEAAALMAG
jgi:predicted dehydrogenase